MRGTRPSDGPPAISVGLAVRNDPERVGRCIESVLAQDLTDLELVICDNASDDETPDTLRRYAREDRRVKIQVNPLNIGLHENMNRVLDASCGTLFRWISADDWLEPHALSTAVSALKDRPDAIGVTSGFVVHVAGAPPRFEHYPGKFPDDHDPAQRFERMLWFFHAGDAKYDPIYGLYRRERLMRTGRVRPNERTDWLLSAELALAAPIVHVSELLVNRTQAYQVGVDRAAFRRRLDPVNGEQLRTSPRSLSRDLYHLAQDAGLDREQLRRCRRALWRFRAHEIARINRMRVSDAVHR